MRQDELMLAQRERSVAALSATVPRLDRFLRSSYSPLLTHLSLVLLAACMLALLIVSPFWLALFPCAMIHHRIGILLHEYVHGIPFRRNGRNLWVLVVFEGILLSCGMLEIFRATHLAHHRWLNTDRDPAMEAQQQNHDPQSWIARLHVLEASQQLKYLWLYLRGRCAYVRARQFRLGMAATLVGLGLWIYLGIPAVILKLMVLTVTTSVMSSLRGAVEHHGPSAQQTDTNEYRVWIPLFNLNRHVDHHLNPKRPWYELKFVTKAPLAPSSYWMHWYHAYIKHDYRLLPPPQIFRDSRRHAAGSPIPAVAATPPPQLREFSVPCRASESSAAGNVQEVN